MDILTSIILGYLVGSINLSYILGKRKGFDIRNRGSGNAGGSNSLITMGTVIGVFVILFDIFKAVAAIKITTSIFPDSTAAFAFTALFCVIGHVFPYYMEFKGGKGFACLAGTVFAFSPLVFLIFLIIVGGIAFLADYLFIVPLIVSVAFPVVYGVITHNVAGAIILFIIVPIVFYKHMENIQRVQNGTEMHLSYLWKKDSEKKRISENSNKITKN